MGQLPDGGEPRSDFPIGISLLKEFCRYLAGNRSIEPAFRSARETTFRSPREEFPWLVGNARLKQCFGDDRSHGIEVAKRHIDLSGIANGIRMQVVFETAFAGNDSPATRPPIDDLGRFLARFGLR